MSKFLIGFAIAALVSGSTVIGLKIKNKIVSSSNEQNLSSTSNKIIGDITVAQTELTEQLANVPKAQTKTIAHINLPSSRTVQLIGPVMEQSAEIAQTITALGESSNDPIYLVINSPGGSVLDGALIVSAIQASHAPVYTVCLQFCASMAAIIHQYGTKRFVVDRSILMFHDAAGGFQGTFPQMKSRMAALDKYVNKMDTDIAQRAGLTFTQFQAKIAYELWLDSDDAVANKFADKIVSVNMNSLGLNVDSLRAISQTRILYNQYQVYLGTNGRP